MIKVYFFVARLKEQILQCNAQPKKRSTQWLKESHTHTRSSTSISMVSMREPSLLSHVSLRTVLKSTALFSPPRAPRAGGVSPCPYSLIQIPPSLPGNPPTFPQPSLLRCSRNILTSILPTQTAWSFSRSITLSCDNARICREDASLSCTLWILCRCESARIPEVGHRATRKAQTTAAGAVSFQQKEGVWAQAVTISASMPKHLLLFKTPYHSAQDFC